jgi:hypothetical protein
MSSPTPRASLLAGLRTGGVRKSSNPPLTASLDFTHSIQDNLLSKSLTAAVDAPSNSFSLQQQSSPKMNPNSVPFSPALPTNIQAQAQALQFQMMQLEFLRLQNLQAQKYQADLLAEAHRQQLSQIRRTTPATAGPTNLTFDSRQPTQIRRNLDSSKQPTHLAPAIDDKLPMSAALGGKFGSRTPTSSLSSSLRFVDPDDSSINATTVISGGTALGTPPPPPVSTPSKSDAATSWRRGGNNNSVLSGNNRSPSVKVTPPSTDRTSPPIPDRNSPPLPTHVTKARPVPLRFSPAVSQPLPVVAVDGSPTDTINSVRADDGYSTSSSSRSLSSPTTPRSSSSSNDLPLSPREEATKKLYEGLGIGRPTTVVVDNPPAAAPHSLTVHGHRLASHPMRQPRGPPSGTDELGPQNFATRLRRKAIGGLGAALLSARERREVVEAY